MIIILLLFLLSCSLGAAERILLFKSDVTVHEDSSLSIVETLQVQATGDAIKRGIVREFPTRYKDGWGNNYVVAFELKEVLKDGTPEPYRTESVDNGKKVYIGRSDVRLQPGIYTYTIAYRTNRQLGFFADHDELYWNVTGNGWRLPIDKVMVTIHLPPSVPRDQLTVEGYTGSFGSKKAYYNAYRTPTGDIVVETTRPLKVFQGLTIAVTWPKGYVHPLTWWQEWWFFFRDNLHIFIALLGLLVILAWYCYAWIRIRATQHLGTVIPLFYPPADMTPGLVRYIARMKYDAVVLAADVVDMAVHGLLTIECVQRFMTTRYTLHKKQLQTGINKQYVLLYETLFGTADTITLDEHQRARLNAAIDVEKNAYTKVARPYFQSAGWYIAGGVAISVIFALAILATIDSESNYILVGAIVLYALLSGWFAHLLRGYTPDGLRIKREIDGFKMFLATTEEERLKIIGTPPTKTPELYEKYLPYAIALGVEKQWAAKFAPVFEELRAAGHPYVFVWYTGSDFRLFNSSSFASTIKHNSGSISSSSNRPGSSSGSGGSGSSGGGGGGGGGGGW